MLNPSNVLPPEQGLTLPAYLPEVESSTCLLLSSGTPSPTLEDPKHPLGDHVEDLSYNNMGDVNGRKRHLGKNDVKGAGDSSSSGSNSIVQDPVSAQLINNISMLDYQTLSKTGDLILQKNDDVIQRMGSLSQSNMKLPSFVNWNWALIRKFLLWFVLSALIACTATVVGMIIALPKTCNPEMPWYQGKVFYEIFPASFKDSNKDSVGDLRGLIQKIDYIKSLNISAIRLNYIFKSSNYPENYQEYSSLLSIDEHLGSMDDFKTLVGVIHDNDMRIILDLPVLSLIAKSNDNESYGLTDVMSTSITFWSKQMDVDGFYLKHLENFVGDPNCIKSLQAWKRIIGFNKILMASFNAFENAKDSANLNVLLSRIDLIDVALDASSRAKNLKSHINEVILSEIWSKPSHPWIHWNIGSVESSRLFTKAPNTAVSLLLMLLTLPGTMSIFYGDEIGLHGLKDAEKDFHEHNQVHNLVQMIWSDEIAPPNMLPWISETPSTLTYLEIIKNFISVRISSPTLYLNAVNKDGNSNKNTKIRTTDEELIVIERWYPRRPSFVFVGNFGDTVLSKDMSSMYYGGKIIASTNHSLVDEYLYFEEFVLKPGASYVIKLEK